MMRVLFVCTGNTCRSPLAEGILRVAARARGIEMEVKSAGLSSYPGLPISQHSATILKEKGLAVDGMRSRQVTEELVRWADLILTMTMAHKEALIRKFPFAVDKTHTLIEYAHAGDEEVARLAKERERLAAELQIKQSLGREVTAEERARLQELERLLPRTDIPDPIGGPLETYRRTAREIEEAINKWLDRLTAGSNKDAGRPGPADEGGREAGQPDVEGLDGNASENPGAMNGNGKDAGKPGAANAHGNDGGKSGAANEGGSGSGEPGEPGTGGGGT